MAEALGVDTSSYPKPTAQPSPLDIAGKLGSMQSQALQINQQKLSQANEALTYLTRAMNAIGPDGSKDQYKRAGADAVNAGLVPPNMLGIWNKKIDDAATPKAFFDEAMTAAASHQETFNYHLGQIRPTETAQGTRLDQLPGKGGQGTPRAFIQRELPPTQPQLGPNNEARLTGSQPPSAAPGIDVPINRLGMSTAPIAKPLPTGAYDPAMVPGMRPGEKAVSAQVQPPTGPAIGFSPGFEEGLKQRTADQDLATQKMTALKPLLLAYPKILDLRSGPGTATWNNAVAFLKANNIVPTQANDPTAIYQEANKYFNQYVSRNGSRSDAEQSAKEMANPDIKTHINPALVELTRKTVAQDRAESARSGAFRDKDFSKYGEHRSQFPQSMNLEAAHLDLLPPDERKKKFNDMLAKAKKGDSNAVRFIKTLDEMKKQNMHDFSLMQ